MAYVPNEQTWMMLGQREPAPRRLTWEELLAEEFTPSERPKAINDLSGLDPAELKQARQDSIFSGLASMGALLQGDQRRAAAGVGELSEIRGRAIQGANARAEAAWQAENQQRAGEHQRGQKEQGAKALHGMYEHVSEGESPAFAARAERAARSGSMAELEKLRQEKGTRARVRDLGVDPDQFTVEELQQQLAMELEKRKRAEELKHKEQETRLLGGITNEQKVALERAQKAEGLDNYYQHPPQWEPLSRIEAKEQIRAKYDAQRDAAKAKGEPAGPKPTLYKQGERIVAAYPPTEQFPQGRVMPLDGQPEQVGSLVYFSVDGIRYVQNKERPELGAREVPLHDADDPQAPPLSEIMKGPKVRQPRSVTRVQIPNDPQPERPLEQRVVDVETAVGPLDPTERTAVIQSLKTMLPRDVVLYIKKKKQERAAREAQMRR